MMVKSENLKNDGKKVRTLRMMVNVITLRMMVKSDNLKNYGKC
jgi:hypothetical protein